MKASIKKIISILLITTLSLALLSCGVLSKKDLSGEYNIDEFLELIAPADEAASEATLYATEDEYTELWSDAYTKAMKKIGFKGGESIVVNGRLLSPSLLSNYASIYISPATPDNSTSDYDNSYFALCDADSYGWVIFLEDNTNIKVQMELLVDDGGYFYFSPVEILSPSFEYASNCHVYEGDKLTAMGEVIDTFSFTMTKEEIDNAALQARGNDYWWYTAMGSATSYIIIEDDTGTQLGAFVDSQYNKDINIGDKIGCTGNAYYYPANGMPDYFMDCTILGGYYIFE